VNQPLKRIAVVGPGIGVGAVVLAIAAFTETPTAWSSGNKLLMWVTMLGGPIWFSWSGMAPYHSFVAFGWLGSLLSAAHPLKPNAITAVVTVVGLALWFWSGFLSMIAAVWGA
jgi:hypothetical protein